jgi:hypothetical protein
MPISIEQIKAMLDSGDLPPSEANIVERGLLLTSDDREVPYEILHGWDLARAHSCDKSWGLFNLKVLASIESKGYDEKSLKEALGEIQMDDAHWRWFNKSLAFSTDEYNWFYLISDNTVQGVCLIYHPKISALEPGDIFYIEYVAVAPWNRKNPIQERPYKGLGAKLIRHAVKFGRTTLKFRYGFSLHALPKAVGFYERIGMVRHDASDKPGLPYFEMPQKVAAEFSEA